MKSSLIVEIAGTPVLLHMRDLVLLDAIKTRCADFIVPPSVIPIELTVDVDAAGFPDHVGIPVDDPRRNGAAAFSEGWWRFDRLDFHVEWSPDSGKGWVRQAHPGIATLDSVLRMIHSILSVAGGGALLHAASVMRNGCAYLFPGISGSGKTTISSLLPSNATLLSDEISYILPEDGGFKAFGTPFAGSLAVPGANASAPLKAVYLLAKGSENKVETVDRKLVPGALLRNVLFFASDPALIAQVFETICRLVDSVPVYRLTFVPAPEVWEIIQ